VTTDCAASPQAVIVEVTEKSNSWKRLNSHKRLNSQKKRVSAHHQLPFTH